MPRLAPISPKKLVRILERLGYVFVRQRGSHMFFRHSSSGLTVTVPFHGSEEIGTGLLKKILSDIELSVEEFNSLR